MSNLDETWGLIAKIRTTPRANKAAAIFTSSAGWSPSEKAQMARKKNG